MILSNRLKDWIPAFAGMTTQTFVGVTTINEPFYTRSKKVCIAIETTGRHLGVALYQFDEEGAPRSVRVFFKETPARQSDLLVPVMDKLMRSAELSKQDLSLVAVDIGPGSFTGVRVGLAAARALAQGLKLPLVGVSSLEVMAWEHVKKNAVTLIVPKILALSGECYFAGYQGDLVRLKPCWKPDFDLKKFLSKNKNAKVVTQPPHPSALAEIAIARYRNNPHSSQFHYENVSPLYLQPSWAERSKASAC